MGKRENVKFHYCGKEIDIVESYRYLGIIFNSVTNIRGDIFKLNATHIEKNVLRAIFCQFKEN
jgi:hypothetical protein